LSHVMSCHFRPSRPAMHHRLCTRYLSSTAYIGPCFGVLAGVCQSASHHVAKVLVDYTIVHSIYHLTKGSLSSLGHPRMLRPVPNIWTWSVESFNGAKAYIYTLHSVDGVLGILQKLFRLAFGGVLTSSLALSVPHEPMGILPALSWLMFRVYAYRGFSYFTPYSPPIPHAWLRYSLNSVGEV
jgi:hypothetical protein